MQDKKYLATIVPLGPQARKQIQKGENLLPGLLLGKLH